MVRCSIKRSIKLFSFVIIAVVILKLFVSNSNRISTNENRWEKKTFDVIVLSSHLSKSLQRLILFLDELRVFNVKILKNNEEWIFNERSLVVFDRLTDKSRFGSIERTQWNVLNYMNDQCFGCIRMKYSDMFTESVTYPTIDFHRSHLVPTVRTSSSPFLIEQSTDFINLLRFKKILPHFDASKSVNDRFCFGLPSNNSLNFKSVIYARHRTSSEKIHLLLFSNGKVLLSSCLEHFWFIWPLLMDSLNYLTAGSYDHYGYQRHIQIDIDDIFLGKKFNERLTNDDVRALISSQSFIQKFVPNFRYRLGFSGYFFDAENKIDDDGDQLLMKEKDRFIWFHHTWKHEKLTQIDPIALISSSQTNLDFAQKYQLPIDRNYAVAPHHTGIYPINSIVYRIWRHFFNFTVTSTENYPFHFNSPSSRRGFIYRDLAVLPRQSCSLYTTTRNYSAYPGGIKRLEQHLMGGTLFRRILTNPISIFMSHNVNYGSDRLANYVFTKLIYVISTWTKLRFSENQETVQLAKRYFDQYYPEDKMPIFTNPCNDRVLMNLWVGNESLCRFFPRFLIIGPQKTGTTALHAMLSHHPDLFSSRKSSVHYEEVQFFSNDTNYLNGIEWYLKQFDTDTRRSVSSMNFEKSATYFDSSLAMKRIKALLPSVHLIMMLTEPGARAYSRYQHELAHGPLKISFDQLLQRSHEKASRESHLKHRCLEPGHYADYIRQWMDYFSHEQISIIDGDEFRRDPRPILDDLQRSFLKLNSSIDVSKLVRFDEKKKFFCPISQRNRSECLGHGKGRLYEPMSSYARQYLDDYYLSHNQKLIRLLSDINRRLPSWLSDKSR